MVKSPVGALMVYWAELTALLMYPEAAAMALMVMEDDTGMPALV